MRRIRHVLGAVRLLATDDRIPRPLRGLAVLGLLPLPGPIDEAILLLVAALLWIFYRERLIEAWTAASPADKALPAGLTARGSPQRGRASPRSAEPPG